MYKFIWLLLTGFLFLQCDKEVRINPDTLQGRWKVVEGERNGQPVNYFSGFFIEFGPGSQLVTNINRASAQESGNFSIEKNKIRQETASGMLQYDVMTYRDSAMVMVTHLNDQELLFVLNK